MRPHFVPSVLFVAAKAWHRGGVDSSDQDAVNAAMQAAVALPAFAVLVKGDGMFGAIGLGLLLAAIYVALISLLGAYFTARLQNLCWNATRSQEVAFSSRLKARALSWLTMKNFCLTVLTLGLYRPFAVVNTTAKRLTAVQVTVDSDIDTWRAGEAQGTDATSGEMAGDFFGIDRGL